MSRWRPGTALPGFRVLLPGFGMLPGLGTPAFSPRVRRVRRVRVPALGARAGAGCGARGWTALGWAAAGLVLFSVYLRLSRTVPVNSDGASSALQGWAMLHGNPLLRGWELSDVSFFTTELPQYAALEAVRGMSPDVVHVAAAMTYTLLVLLAGLVAAGRRGSATDRIRLLRAAVAAGIMLAPWRGTGVYVLLLSPDHAGSAVPVLAACLLLDRAARDRRGRRRWWVPPLAGLALAWALAADPVVLIWGVAPLAVVAGVRAYRIVVRRGGSLGDAWFELLLALSAAAAIPAARLILQAIAAHGGFYVWPVGNQLGGLDQLAGSLGLTVQGVLVLFGANFADHTVGYVAALGLAHLAGVALAGWGLCAALRRFGHRDLAVQLLAASAVAALAAYLLGRSAVDLRSSREFSAVLPFGAALAGRLLAGRALRAGMVPALSLFLTAYLLGLGRLVALPAVPAQGGQLAAFLAARHLDYGLGGYWDANVVTLASRGTVRIRSVISDGPDLARDTWETRPDWYDPARHWASFVVLGQGQRPSVATVEATFGQPSRIYGVGSYTVLTFGQNLLATLRSDTVTTTVGG